MSFSLLLVAVCFFHLASSQHCSLPLQCSGASDFVNPGLSPNQGLPGKRGPKGEKGDPFDGNGELIRALKDSLTSLQDRLNVTEVDLEAEKAKVKILGDQVELLGDIKPQPTAFSLVTAGILILRSCKDISEILNVRINGTYKIQPISSLPPFNVNCRFNGNTVFTSIEHDSETEIQVDKCESTRCYGRPINYHITIPQIRAVMELAGECRQYLKYRCIGSVLRGAGWENWNGELRQHWGGGEGRDGYCTCGIAGTCVECSNHCGKCNCDINSGTHEDSGYLTLQDDLPVTKLYFGDAGDDGEYGFHTLGQLECFQ